MDACCAPPQGRGLFRLTMAALAAALTTGAAADEWPALRQGLWDFKRSMEGTGAAGPPKAVQTQRCIVPTADFKQQKEMLTKGGCTFTPVTRAGNVYS